jgi:hypothetical protein
VAAGYIAASNASADRMNYRHMVPARTYGEVVGILGRLAGLGDMYADAASQALRKVSPWLNDWQIMAQVAEAFRAFICAPWEDVREATGPEAGRPSSHITYPALVNAVILHLAMTEMQYALQLGATPGPGWCLREIAHEVGAADHIRSAFPKTAQVL